MKLINQIGFGLPTYREIPPVITGGAGFQPRGNTMEQDKALAIGRATVSSMGFPPASSAISPENALLSTPERHQWMVITTT